MAYQALYRKWRPLIFDDVIGQGHITQTLKNEIINGKTAHAYLFCGTRGTGKTSTAKILSRGVNCLNPQEGNPCNECDVCKGILDETIMDVVELDAASRTGVDDIRQIIEEVMFSPAVARKKVYIIDEVHMISTNAFNALLKTLEEPPSHVMFILATTELHKIPATVLSRCQRFDFRRITNADIVSRLKTILDGDGYSVSDQGLELVAQLGDGSMRDSLSILDQCLSFREQNLTHEDIINIIGIADDKSLYTLCLAIADYDSESAIHIFDETVACGKEPGVFIENLVKFLRDVLIVKLTKKPEEILHTSQENISQMTELARVFTQNKLTNALRILNESVVQAKYSTFARTLYELALIKICDPQTDRSVDGLLERMEQLEKQIAEGITVASQPPKKSKTKAPEKPVPLENEKPKKEPEPKDLVEQTSPYQTEERWAEILLAVKTNGGLPIYSHLAKVKAMKKGGKLLLVFDENSLMSKNVINKPANLELVAKAVREVTGQELAISCHSDKEIGEPAKKTEQQWDELEKLSHKHSVIEII